jgi:hypothetical protein
MGGASRTADMRSEVLSCVKVNIKLSHTEDGWKVDRCMVWITTSQGKLIQSGDRYKSHGEAVTEMKRRSMKYIAGRGKSETVDQVKWHIDLPAEPPW